MGSDKPQSTLSMNLKTQVGAMLGWQGQACQDTDKPQLSPNNDKSQGKTLLPRNTSGLVANDVASASHLRDIEENRHQLDPIGLDWIGVHSLN